MTVFDAFKQIEYTYLVVSRGEVYGNRVTEQTGYLGVFKLREGMTEAVNVENRTSSATLHVHPEDFMLEEDETIDDYFVGDGVRVDGVDYSIVGVTGGKNFDTGVLEHYQLTLQRTEYVDEG